MTRPPEPRSRSGADAGSRIGRSRTLQGSALGSVAAKTSGRDSARFDTPLTQKPPSWNRPDAAVRGRAAERLLLALTCSNSGPQRRPLLRQELPHLAVVESSQFDPIRTSASLTRPTVDRRPMAPSLSFCCEEGIEGLRSWLALSHDAACQRECELKDGTLGYVRGRPQSSAVRFDDRMADR